MFKVLTVIAFLSAQVMPFQVYAQNGVVTEFEKSAQKIQEELAAEKAAKEKKTQLAALRNGVRDNAIQLAARVEELETLAEQIPNVREDVIEDTARSLNAAEVEDDNEDTFGIAAVVAVASGVVYALTKYDVPKAWAHVRASQVKSAPAKAEAVKVKTTPVSKGLRSVYGNKIVARSSATVGVLATLVAAIAYGSSYTMSVDEIAAIETLENTYLSQLVSGGKASHLTEDEIEYALTKRYNDDPAFREAVLNEVRTIVSETDRLNGEIAAQKQEIVKVSKL